VKYGISISILLGLLVGMIWYIPTFMVVLALATLLAFVLDPAVTWLQRRRIGRGISSTFLIFGIGILASLLIVPQIPTLVEQLTHAFRSFPAEYDRIIAPYLREKFGGDMSWRTLALELPEYFQTTAPMESMLYSFRRSLGNLLGVMVHGILFLMVAFMILRDWHTIIAGIRRLFRDAMPDDWQEDIDEVFGKISHSISKLLRGQLKVSSILAIYYFSAFQTIAVVAGGFDGIGDFFQRFFTPSAWMLVGLITGYLNMIPYLGVPTGGLVAAILGLTVFQFQQLWIYPLILLVVTAGVTIDHKALTPVVIGDSVSVHELWVYFAIYLGFSVGGVMGVILALPAMAVIGVVTKHLVSLWREHRHTERLAAMHAQSPSKAKPLAAA
jgi:predicted PurR-regulated permease PerM